MSKLIDSTVVDADGNAIGVIDEIILQCATGRVTRVIVRRHDHSRSSYPWTDFEISDAHFVLKALGDNRR